MTQAKRNLQKVHLAVDDLQPGDGVHWSKQDFAVDITWMQYKINNWFSMPSQPWQIQGEWMQYDIVDWIELIPLLKSYILLLIQVHRV